MIRRQREQDSIYRNGPAKIVRPTRNIWINPIPGPGGFSIYWFTMDVDVSFSQNSTPINPSIYRPAIPNYGPWTYFEAGKMLGLNAKENSMTANIINVESTASATESRTGASSAMDARCYLNLEMRDQTGADMFINYNPIWIGVHSTITQNAVGGSYILIYGATTTPPATPSYPTQYRWVGMLAGTCSLAVKGTLLMQASVA
jgi:hypothetical protein